jgi:hypothetical protein
MFGVAPNISSHHSEIHLKRNSLCVEVVAATATTARETRALPK